jgi:tetratricopeptide (TPR) repeat protein
MTVTSLFDTPQLFPAMAVFCAILLALTTTRPALEVTTERRPLIHRRIAFGNVALTAGWLAVCGGLAWSLRAYRVFSGGVLAANLDRWAEAGTTLDEAAQLDPRLAFYWLQAGYAHGQAGLRQDGSAADAAQVSAALADFERGLGLEPYLATNWANVGMLRWAAGDDGGAQIALERAVAAAPSEMPFRLTLGRLYEARGNVDGAREAFAQALAARPEWSDTYFFRATPLRLAAAADWRAQNPAGWRPGGTTLAGAWASLEAGQFDAARAAFQSATGLNTAEPYLGLGLAYLGLADYIEADRALRTAQFVPGLSGYIDVLIQFALARLASARGRPAEAIAAYEDGLGRLNGTTSFGIGLLGNSDYGWYVFNRESIQPDLLPGIDAAPPTDEAVRAMLALAGLYRDQGDAAAAEKWFCKGKRAAPDLAAAAPTTCTNAN